jgi:hypothetical protein
VGVALSQLQPGDPRRAGAYAIRARLGSGGMGQVFLADGPRGDRVAVKLLHPHVAADAQARARLGRELRTLSRVRGPHLAEVVDADVDASHPFLVTRYVPGRTLDERVSAEGPLDAGALLATARGLVTALAAVHAAGVVHRDLKPSNVICGPDGPTLLDFGVARAVDESALTRTGEVWGTPAYLAPEQAVTGRAEPASDIHALGATLVYAATARPLFGTGRADAVLYRVVHDTPTLPVLTGPLGALLPRMLARDPGARPSAAELLELLSRPRGGAGRTSVLTAASAAPTLVATRAGTAPPPPGSAAGPRPAHQALPAGSVPRSGLPGPASRHPARPVTGGARPGAGDRWSPRPAPAAAGPPWDPRAAAAHGRGPALTAGPWAGKAVGVLAVLALTVAALVAPLAVPLAAYAVLLPLHDALGRTVAAAAERRLRRGPRATDGLVSTVGLAGHLLRALLGAALRLPLALAAGVVVAGVGFLAALAWGADGPTALTWAAAAVTSVLGAWLLSPRRQPPAAAARADLRRRAGASGTGATAALLVLCVLLALTLSRSGEPVWLPLPGPPSVPEWLSGLRTLP